MDTEANGNNLFPDISKVHQQGVLRTNIKNPTLDTNTMQNAGTIIRKFVVFNNNILTFTNTITSNINKNNRLGALPFQAAFFLNSISKDNLIPFGANVNPLQWIVTGPMAMPQFKPGGTDGNNLVIKTSVTNTTGSSQTCFYLSDLRLIQSGKGGGL